MLCRTRLALAVVLSVSAAALADDKPGTNWPQFRGPFASGVADGHPLPTTWNVETGENIKWKTKIPGLAHSSPIVWGDKVFVTTAVSSDPNPYLKVGLYGESPKHEEKIEHEFRVLCLSKQTGAILWDQLAVRGIPKIARHIKATHANCTAATDGHYVVAFFGSEGMVCFDMDGHQKWLKQFDVIDSGPAGDEYSDLHWGYASSPVLHDGKVIVQVDGRKEAYVAVYDLKTGKGIWKTERPLYPTWGSPTIHVGKDVTQVIVNGYSHIGGYDFADGKELWKLQGGGDVPVPTPVVSDDLIFITNAHGGQSPVYAIKTSARGDITLKSEQAAEEKSGKEGTAEAGPGAEAPRSSEHIAWSHPKIGNYMQTPLVYGGLLYLCRDNGIMACHDAKTGKNLYKERLAEGVGFTSSPVAGDGKVYFTSEEGDVHVLKAGDKFERLVVNKLGEIHMSTPAISEGTIFFRAKDHLIAVANVPKSDTPAKADAPPEKRKEAGSH